MAGRFKKCNKGDLKNTGKKLFTITEKLQDAGYRASQEKFEFYLKRTTWLGQEIIEHGIKPKTKKIKSILLSKLPKSITELESFHGAIKNFAKLTPKFSEKTDRLTQL